MSRKLALSAVLALISSASATQISRELVDSKYDSYTSTEREDFQQEVARAVKASGMYQANNNYLVRDAEKELAFSNKYATYTSTEKEDFEREVAKAKKDSIKYQ